MEKTEIKMGDIVRCKITGFEGKVIAISHWLYGCTQVVVQPPCNDKGEWVKAQWIDEPQVEVVKSTKDKPAKPRHGGIRSTPGD